MHVVDSTLFFSETSGGVRRYLLAKHEWLARQPGMRHTILVPGRHARFERDGVTLRPGWLLPGTFNYRLPLGLRAWTRTLEQLEPDLIEAGDAFHPAWSALRVAARRGIPAVAFFHSNLPELLSERFGTQLGHAAKRYLRWLYGHFDAVLAPSRLMCEHLESLGVARVVHQPLGVDMEVFSPGRRMLDVRARLGLAADTRLLGYAGRFSAEKNLHVLRAAFARLGEPYHLLLIGGSATRRVASNVSMVSYRADSCELAAWLASVDALVHAGTKETFGLVIVETMACGRPVIGTRAAAVPEIVDDSVGALVKAHDPADFAAQIVALYERDIEALGKAARARAEQRFSWQHAFQQQLSTYARLARSSRAVPAASDARIVNGL